MRRFVAIFLLMLLPLHAIWAAAAPYCQHEGSEAGEAAQHHIGHHHPEHHHATDHADHGDAGAAEHSDCHVCHSGVVLAHEVHTVQVLAESSTLTIDVTRGLPAPPAKRPERPKWPALA